MMYQRTDLTLSMFYASSADADGNKVATLTMQVIAAEAGAVQTSHPLTISGVWRICRQLPAGTNT